MVRLHSGMFFIGFALGDADRSDPQRTNLGYYLLPFFFLLCGGLFGELDSTFRPFPCLSYAEAQPIFAARKGREKKAKNITFAPLFRRSGPEPFQAMPGGKELRHRFGFHGGYRKACRISMAKT